MLHFYPKFTGQHCHEVELYVLRAHLCLGFSYLILCCCRFLRTAKLVPAVSSPVFLGGQMSFELKTHQNSCRAPSQALNVRPLKNSPLLKFRGVPSTGRADAWVSKPAFPVSQT